MSSLKEIILSREGWIFDLDGVLVDSYDCWFQMLQDVVRDQGRDPISREVFDEAWGQGVEEDQRMFFPGWTVEEVMQFYDRTFPKYAHFVKTDEVVAQVLKMLKNRGKKTAVASNSTRHVVKCLLDQARAASHVDEFIGADEVRSSKPAPDLILKAAEKLGTTISKSCYIGDSIFDEKAARAAGIIFVGFKREGDYRINTLNELLDALR